MRPLAVIVPFTRPQFHDRVVQMFYEQSSRVNASLFFVLNGDTRDFKEQDDSAEYVVAPKDGKAAALNFALGFLGAYYDYACVWDDDDLYGPAYLHEVLRCKDFGVTGLDSFVYRNPSGAEKIVAGVGFQGGTLAFPTRGVPLFNEGVSFAEELIWRDDLKAQGREIYARLPGDYTYCRYSDPNHHHAFPNHPTFGV